MADLVTLAQGEKDIDTIVNVVRQVVERFQPAEAASAGNLKVANNLSDVANLETTLNNLSINATVTEVGDTNYTILSADWVIVTTTAFTASRTWTLPAASAVKPRHPIVIIDRAAAVTATNTLIVQRAGSDTFNNGGTSFTITTAVAGLRLYSDGVSKWTLEFIVAGANPMFDRITSTRGAIPSRGAAAWGGINPGTATHVLTSNGAGADPTYQAVPAQTILQCLQTTYTTNADLSTTIPLDDTVPTSTEGTEVLSQAITPADNTNKVLVIVHVWGAVNTANSAMITVLFRGSTAIQVASHTFASTNFPACVSFAFLDSPASASAQTYSVRVGANTGIVRLNGSTAARQYGGAASSTLTLMEVAA
jgi:hypothetical protein